ncbi:hypothetical protein hrd7_33360 (plasmid) [Leptolinea sp. HRD-7]|nr:hypothetical protein hrd7_33360 [Leptolinea sp. HRD-7]
MFNAAAAGGARPDLPVTFLWTRSFPHHPWAGYKPAPTMNHVTTIGRTDIMTRRGGPRPPWSAGHISVDAPLPLPYPGGLVTCPYNEPCNHNWTYRYYDA